MQEGGLLLGQLCATLAERVRVTAARGALLACIAAEPKRAWTADDLLAACNAEQPGMASRASVYRLLELLCAAGLLAVQPQGKGRAKNIAVSGSTSGCQRYALTAEALGEICLTDDAGSSQRIAASPELQLALTRVCRNHRWVIREFSIEVRGEYRPRRAATPGE